MAEPSVDGSPSLPELFQKGWEAQKKIESGDLSSGSAEFKSCLAGGIHALEMATRLASELSLFSSNEEIEEIATADLKYLLLPALLGDLTLQIMEGSRLETIRKARVYVVDYLQRCKSYAITSEDPPPPSLPSPSPSPSSAVAAPPPNPNPKKSFDQLATERTAKIARLREQKEMEKKLQELAERLDSTSVDEELIREHLITLLKSWVYKCRDHVTGIDREVEILEEMERMKGDRVARQPAAAAPLPQRQPMKPFVITREMLLRNQVFGAGYPSVPTVSLEEFYQQRYQEHLEEQRRQAAQPLPSEGEEKMEEEEEEEEESEEALKKAREFDDFKDTHRRGWGNKKNMG